MLKLMERWPVIITIGGGAARLGRRRDAGRPTRRSRLADGLGVAVRRGPTRRSAAQPGVLGGLVGVVIVVAAGTLIAKRRQPQHEAAAPTAPSLDRGQGRARGENDNPAAAPRSNGARSGEAYTIGGVMQRFVSARRARCRARRAVRAPGAGLGAHQERRVHHPGRHRRRRRPDGARDPGHRRQARPDEAVDAADQQGGRRRRRGLPRREERAGRPAQDHHHAVQPVHHAARHRRAVQLARPDAGADAGARQLRAVGQRQDALQDARRSTSRRRRRPARAR